MSTLFDRWLRRAFARPNHSKTSATGPMMALYQTGRPVWTPRDYASLAKEGFQTNPIVYRAVRMIAEAAASVPLLLYDGGKELADHPLLRLMATPNPRDSGTVLREALFGYLLVSGNAYLEAVSDSKQVRELYALRPDRMRVVPGADGWPAGYEYQVGGQAVQFDQHAAPVPQILHLTLFHPLNDHYGLSPMEAAAASIDIHNAAGGWNKALLDNAARPSGALVYAGPPGATLGAEQFERLKSELEASFQGSANAGRPLLLEGGLDWKPLSLTPKDMDFMEAKAAAARDIALAFGVPPMLLGLPGDNTYANYAEANRIFWRQTVIPLASRIADSIAHWLSPVYGAVKLQPDLDRIDALSQEREALWSRLGKANFLNVDEKREAVGYGPLHGASTGKNEP
ncbi:MAG: phage portal protein [Beijerinckiaceae bacterium]